MRLRRWRAVMPDNTTELFKPRSIFRAENKLQRARMRVKQDDLFSVVHSLFLQTICGLKTKSKIDVAASPAIIKRKKVRMSAKKSTRSAGALQPLCAFTQDVHFPFG